MYDFSVDFRACDTINITNIRKYLTEKQHKIMSGLIRKMFPGLLTAIVHVSNHTKYMLLSNQKCMIQPTIINVHRNEYIQEFHYYLLAVKLDVLEVAILLMTYLIMCFK